MSPRSTRLRPSPIRCLPSRLHAAACRAGPSLAGSGRRHGRPAAAETEPAGPCADAAPGSHVEAACEGPTEDNPSLSIKKRLKRAQFFDQREQLVAAGMAVPVERDAGLPDAVEVPEPAEATREPV